MAETGNCRKVCGMTTSPHWNLYRKYFQSVYLLCRCLCYNDRIGAISRLTQAAAAKDSAAPKTERSFTMAKFEALMENKMNPDTQTEQSKPQSRDLSDQELAQASGGRDPSGRTDPYGGIDTAWKTDSQGRVTHWKTGSGQIFHYTCPRCGRILHEGTLGFFYCDPCDDWCMAGSANMVIDQEASDGK